MYLFQHEYIILNTLVSHAAVLFLGWSVNLELNFLNIDLDNRYHDTGVVLILQDTVVGTVS